MARGKPEEFKKRYNKYDGGVDIHWVWYAQNKNSYKDLVDAALKPFQGLKGSVVDIGCGDGLIGSLLIKQGFEVIGVEPEPAGIALCNSKVPKMQTIMRTIENYIEIMRPVDFLFSFNTIEHVEKPEAYLEAMKQVRQFAVIITDDRNFHTKIDPLHYREYTYEQLADFFKGFRTERVETNNPEFIGIKVYAKN